MFNTLRIRLIIIFSCLSFLPLVIAGAFSTVRTYKQLVETSIQNQRVLDARVGQAIQDTFSARINELAVLGDTFVGVQLPLSQQRDLLNSLLIKSQAYQELALVDPDGRELI